MGYVEKMLGQHEKLVFVTHQHWMTLVGSALQNLLLAILITVVVMIANVYTGNSLLLVGLALWLIPIGRFVYHFLVWDNQEYIITNRRVIQIEGIVNKNVLDSSLEKVNDVKMSQSVLGRMFDYADLEILTASELAPNLFRRIMGPIRFKTAMLNQKEAMSMPEEEGAGFPAGLSPVLPQSPDVPTMIEHLDQLRKQGVISEDEFQRKKQELLARI